MIRNSLNRSIIQEKPEDTVSSGFFNSWMGDFVTLHRGYSQRHCQGHPAGVKGKDNISLDPGRVLPEILQDIDSKGIEFA